MRLVIIGAGFAGMYAALSAARLREIQGVSPEELEIALVAPEPTLVVRPRLYEPKPETLTAPLLNNAVRINLPKTAATTPATPNKSVTVSVDGDNRVYIDKREVALDALEPELRTLVGADPELSLSLQADEAVPYRSVAQVIAHIQRSGVSKLSVLTEPAS